MEVGQRFRKPSFRTMGSVIVAAVMALRVILFGQAHVVCEKNKRISHRDSVPHRP